jgi:signal transduction histidine kinase
MFFLIWKSVSGYDSIRVVLLKDSLKIVGNDSIEASLLNKIAAEMAYLSPDSSTHYARLALHIALKRVLAKDIAQAKFHIGSNYEQQGNFDSASFYLYDALKYFEEVEDRDMTFKAFLKIARMHIDRRESEDAGYYYEQALSLAKDLNNDSYKAKAYNGLGAFYIQQGWNMVSDELTPDTDSIKKNSFFLKAAPYLDTAIIHYEKVGEERGAILSRSNQAIILRELGKYHDAISSIKKALTYFRQNDEKIFEVIALNELAHNYYFLRNYDSALIAANLELALAEELNSSIDQRNAHGRLMEIYEAMGQFEQAFYSYQQFQKLYTQLQDEERQRQISMLEEQYAAEKKEQQILLLQKQQEIQKANLEQRTSYLLFAMVALAGTGLIAYTLKTKNKEIRQQKSELLNSNAELKAQSEEIRAQRDLLENRNKTIEEQKEEQNNFMSVIAHDLKSPLNKIHGLAEVVKITGTLNEEQQDALSKMVEVATSGRELISELNNLHQLEKGMLSIDFKPYLLKDILQKALDEHHGYANNKGIRLVSEIESLNGALFRTEAKYFHRILDNLLSNAIKFSSRGTKVLLSAQIENDTIKVLIKDQGPGFSDEDQTKMFSKFQRLSAKPTGGEASSGLGLYIVKLLTETLGGVIKVYSEEGKGATFELLFTQEASSFLPG